MIQSKVLIAAAVGLVMLLATAWTAPGEPPRSIAAQQPAELAVTAAPQEEPQEEPQGRFAPDAFPPAIPDTKDHARSWFIQDCLRCHETGVGDAPEVRHATVPPIAMVAKCRSCHVLIPGLKPRKKPPPTPDEQAFLPNAFPPMIPASDSHQAAWLSDDCLLCHESGIKGAPLLKHEGLPPILLEAKCRSCHVQIRSAFQPGR